MSTLIAYANRNPAADDPKFTKGLIVRFTPELYELLREGAATEQQGLAEFMRDAAILRLGALGLVPFEDDHEPG